MNKGMPKKLPQYVYSERTRHGKLVFYFRRGKGQRTRLPDINADDFEQKYHSLLTALEPPTKKAVGAGTLEWLVKRHKETGAYMALSPATRKQRDNILKGVVEIGPRRVQGHYPQEHHKGAREAFSHPSPGEKLPRCHARAVPMSMLNFWQSTPPRQARTPHG